MRTRDLRIGLVLFLSNRVLMRSPHTVFSFRQGFDLFPGKDRPHVLIEHSGDGQEATTVWAPLTTKERLERLLIRPEWRSGGLPPWRENPNYLSDGARIVVCRARVAAGASCVDACDPSDPAMLSMEGVEAVRAVVKACNPARVWVTRDEVRAWQESNEREKRLNGTRLAA